MVKQIGKTGTIDFPNNVPKYEKEAMEYELNELRNEPSTRLLYAKAIKASVPSSESEWFLITAYTLNDKCAEDFLSIGRSAVRAVVYEYDPDGREGMWSTIQSEPQIYGCNYGVKLSKYRAFQNTDYFIDRVLMDKTQLIRYGVINPNAPANYQLKYLDAPVERSSTARPQDRCGVSAPNSEKGRGFGGLKFSVPQFPRMGGFGGMGAGIPKPSFSMPQPESFGTSNQIPVGKEFIFNDSTPCVFVSRGGIVPGLEEDDMQISVARKGGRSELEHHVRKCSYIDAMRVGGNYTLGLGNGAFMWAHDDPYHESGRYVVYGGKLYAIDASRTQGGKTVWVSIGLANI